MSLTERHEGTERKIDEIWETDLITETLKRSLGRRALTALFAPLRREGDLIRLQDADFAIGKALCEILSLHFQNTGVVWAKHPKDLEIIQPSVILVDATIHDLTSPSMTNELDISNLLQKGHRLILCNFSTALNNVGRPKVFLVNNGFGEENGRLKEDVDQMIGILEPTLNGNEYFSSRVNFAQIMMNLRHFVDGQ